jgi:hypothetical protein
MALYTLALRRWHLRWGATWAEVRAPMLGDDLVQRAMLQATRAIHIKAPPEAAWPWLVQMGAGRAGFYSFYSFEWLERLSGMDSRNANVIHPEWQNLEVGGTMSLGPTEGFEVLALEPPRRMLLRVRGSDYDVTVSIQLEAAGMQWTRLLVRLRARSSLAGWRLPYWLLFEPGDFVMIRQMLRGIRARAEGTATRPHRQPAWPGHNPKRSAAGCPSG